jgi:hypothetical protein
MLVLPEGLCFGRVDPTILQTSCSCIWKDAWTTGAYADAPRCRMRCEPHSISRGAYGDDRIASFSPLSVVKGKHRIRVTLSGEPGPVTDTFRKELSEPLMSQCHAQVPGRITTFALDSLMTR